jgi:hypothetical protein
METEFSGIEQRLEKLKKSLLNWSSFKEKNWLKSRKLRLRGSNC